MFLKRWYGYEEMLKIGNAGLVLGISYFQKYGNFRESEYIIFSDIRDMTTFSAAPCLIFSGKTWLYVQKGATLITEPENNSF